MTRRNDKRIDFDKRVCMPGYVCTRWLHQYATDFGV